MFQKNQAEILEKACILLKEVKINDRDFKDELILEIQCTIHKYAETDEDIQRLEKVISMETIEGLSNYPDNWHLEEFYYIGYSKGESSMILKFIDALGIDEVVRITGLSQNTVKNYLNEK